MQYTITIPDDLTVVYRCTLAHTAWAGTGWTPDVSTSLWVAV